MITLTRAAKYRARGNRLDAQDGVILGRDDRGPEFKEYDGGNKKAVKTGRREAATEGSPPPHGTIAKTRPRRKSIQASPRSPWPREDFPVRIPLMEAGFL